MTLSAVTLDESSDPILAEPEVISEAEIEPNTTVPPKLPPPLILIDEPEITAELSTLKPLGPVRDVANIMVSALNEFVVRVVDSSDPLIVTELVAPSTESKLHRFASFGVAVISVSPTFSVCRSTPVSVTIPANVSLPALNSPEILTSPAKEPIPDVTFKSPSS